MEVPLIFILILLTPIFMVPLAFACCLILDSIEILLAKAQGNQVANLKAGKP